GWWVTLLLLFRVFADDKDHTRATTHGWPNRSVLASPSLRVVGMGPIPSQSDHVCSNELASHFAWPNRLGSGIQLFVRLLGARPGGLRSPGFRSAAAVVARHQLVGGHGRDTPDSSSHPAYPFAAYARDDSRRSARVDRR